MKQIGRLHSFFLIIIFFFSTHRHSSVFQYRIIPWTKHCGLLPDTQFVELLSRFGEVRIFRGVDKSIHNVKIQLLRHRFNHIKFDAIPKSPSFIIVSVGRWMNAGDFQWATFSWLLWHIFSAFLINANAIVQSPLKFHFNRCNRLTTISIIRSDRIPCPFTDVKLCQNVNMSAEPSFQWWREYRRYLFIWTIFNTNHMQMSCADSLIDNQPIYSTISVVKKYKIPSFAHQTRLE